MITDARALGLPVLSPTYREPRPTRGPWLTLRPAAPPDRTATTRLPSVRDPSATRRAPSSVTSAAVSRRRATKPLATRQASSSPGIASRGSTDLTKLRESLLANCPDTSGATIRTSPAIGGAAAALHRYRSGGWADRAPTRTRHSSRAGLRCRTAETPASWKGGAVVPVSLAAPFRPTQQRADAPSGSPGLLLCPVTAVSPCAPGRRPFRERLMLRQSAAAPATRERFHPEAPV